LCVTVKETPEIQATLEGKTKRIFGKQEEQTLTKTDEIILSTMQRQKIWKNKNLFYSMKIRHQKI
jgi:hypothetical protein